MNECLTTPQHENERIQEMRRLKREYLEVGEYFEVGTGTSTDP